MTALASRVSDPSHSQTLPGFPMIRREAWPLSALVLVLALQFTMIFTRAINWDEFWHYSLVVQLTRGTLTQPLQTFFVRLFQWLPLLPGAAVDHIIAARVVMFVCEVVTVAAIAALASRFTGRTVGLLCALGYVSVAFVLQNGFAFRADPVAAALLMSALWILACTSFRGAWLFLFGALVGLAGIYTIKSILYAPAFAGLAWMRWREDNCSRVFLLRCFVAAIAASACFLLLYIYHSKTGVFATTSDAKLLQHSAQKMFFVGVPRYWRSMVQFASGKVFLSALFLLFPLAVAKIRLVPSAKVALVGLYLPITTLAFYFNTLPYFYTFMLPPVLVACSASVAMFGRRFDPVLLTVPFLFTAAVAWIEDDPSVIDRQRQVEVAAQLIFPANISYFDFCGMLPSFHKANAFMSEWGSELYRNGSLPPMRAEMQGEVVPLVLAVDDMFTELFQTTGPSPDFRPDDAAALRETYLHFWGPFWVAGRNISANARPMAWDVLVPGPYTVSGGEIQIGGRVIHPGEVINLHRGTYRLSPLHGRAARLIWGSHLRVPDQPAPVEPYWVGF